MKNKHKKIIFLLTTVGLIILPIIPVHAFEIVPACAKTGDEGICCFLRLLYNISRLILGVVGSLSLLMLIWGGAEWILSRGNPEKVKNGMRRVTGTVVGIFVVVIAWFVVNWVITTLAGSASLNGNDMKWYELCKDYKFDKCDEQYGKDGWSCQNIKNCGINSYDECTAQNDCAKNLCSGDETTVCCKGVTSKE